MIPNIRDIRSDTFHRSDQMLAQKSFNQNNKFLSLCLTFTQTTKT